MDAQLAGNAQFPAPLIYAAVGDVVEIRLKNLGVAANPNAPNDPHSIHLHGLDVDAANDGVPETSVGAVPANLCADGTTAATGATCAQPAPGAGNVIVYMFTPKHAGTYMYHCHQEADIHVQMGMYGALVVYNPTDAAAADRPRQGARAALGRLQVRQGLRPAAERDRRPRPCGRRGHVRPEEVSSRQPPGIQIPTTGRIYQPQYWFINGLSFPNTIHVGFPSGYTCADWIAAHPGYDPFITGSVSRPERQSLEDTGSEGPAPHDQHGLRDPAHAHARLPRQDHRLRPARLGLGEQAGPSARLDCPFGQGLEKNTLTIGSGETYEWLVDFGQQSVPVRRIRPARSRATTQRRTCRCRTRQAARRSR